MIPFSGLTLLSKENLLIGTDALKGSNRVVCGGSHDPFLPSLLASREMNSLSIEGKEATAWLYEHLTTFLSGAKWAFTMADLYTVMLSDR